MRLRDMMVVAFVHVFVVLTGALVGEYAAYSCSRGRSTDLGLVKQLHSHYLRLRPLSYVLRVNVSRDLAISQVRSILDFTESGIL